MESTTRLHRRTDGSPLTHAARLQQLEIPPRGGWAPFEVMPPMSIMWRAANFDDEGVMGLLPPPPQGGTPGHLPPDTLRGKDSSLLTSGTPHPPQLFKAHFIGASGHQAKRKHSPGSRFPPTGMEKDGQLAPRWSHTGPSLLLLMTLPRSTTSSCSSVG